MINRCLKNLLIKIVASLFVLSCVCALAFNPNASKVKASETASEIAKIDGFSIVNGAYVRIPENDSDIYGVTDENGIRFVFYLSDSITKASIEKISTLVSVDTAITDLTIENVTETNGKVTEKVWDKDNVAYDSETNRYTQNIDLVNFPTTEYHSEVTVRGYIKTTEGEYYTDQLMRTMAGVANYHAINVSEDAEALSAYIGTEKSSNGDCGFAVVNKEATLSVNGLSEVTEAIAVYINQHKAAGVTVNNGNVTIPASVTKTLTSGETYTLSVFESDGVHRAEFKAIDYAIGTASEFVEFLTATATGEPVHAILTADIDYSGNEWTYNYVGSTSDKYFQGSLDGQGHTVDNVSVRNGIFMGINNATVKNIAFTNITTTHSNSASLFSWNTNGKNVLENVFLHGNLSSITTACAGISNNTSTIEMKNVVVYVEFGKNTEFNAINRDGNLGSMSNVYAISTTAANLANAATVMGATLYTDAKAYASVANDKISEFDETYWTAEGGVIMFKSAKAKLSAVSADTSMDKDVFLKDGETYYVVKGTYNVAVDGCTVILESAVENVTLANGVLTIGEGASVGSKVKVLAIDPIYGTVIDSVEVTVAAVQELTSKGGVVGKNRSDKLSLTFGTNLSAEDIKSVSFGGVAIKSSDYTVTGNKIDINSAKLVTKENGVLSVIFVKDGTIYNYIVTDVKVCDFAIGTADEFNAWLAAVRATTYSGSGVNMSANKPYYAVMTANVNMQDVALTSKYNTNCCATGIFDGQGYAISNLKLDNTMFRTMANFTMKNVAWKNVVNGSNNYMLNTTSPAQTNDFINCYFEFESTPSQSPIWHIGSAIRNIENVVIVNNFTWSGQPVIRGGAPASIKNVFAISQNSSGVVNTLRSESTNPAENCGSYADVNALKAALEAENATVTLNGFTDNEYWDVTAGYPVWKTKNA